jgi:hypothetical protein
VQAADDDRPRPRWRHVALLDLAGRRSLLGQIRSFSEFCVFVKPGVSTQCGSGRSRARIPASRARYARASRSSLVTVLPMYRLGIDGSLVAAEIRREHERRRTSRALWQAPVAWTAQRHGGVGLSAPAASPTDGSDQRGSGLGARPGLNALPSANSCCERVVSVVATRLERKYGVWYGVSPVVRRGGVRWWADALSELLKW